MKKILALILAVSMIFAMAVTTSAASNDVVKRGTAIVDGNLDPAYNDSLILFNLGTQPNVLTDKEWLYDCYADVYFLYDDERLYVYCDVTDNDVVDVGKTFFEENYNAYQADLVELRFSFDGSEHDIIKVSIDAFGHTMFGLTEHYDKIDYTSFKYKTKITNKGYAIELSMPCTKGRMDMIETGKLGFTYSLNDIDADGNHYEFAEKYDMKVEWTAEFYDLSEEKANTNATPPKRPAVTTAPETTAEPETTPAPETTVAPETTEAPEETTGAPETTDAPDDTVAPEDTTAADAEQDTTIAEGDDTTAVEGDDTAEVEDTTVADEADTTVAEVEDDTTAAEDEDDTTAAEDEDDTTVSEDEETTADKKDDEGGINPAIIIAIVAAVVVIAGIAIALAKKKKN